MSQPIYDHGVPAGPWNSVSANTVKGGALRFADATARDAFVTAQVAAWGGSFSACAANQRSILAVGQVCDLLSDGKTYRLGADGLWSDVTPAKAADLTTEAATRASADTALSGRLDTVETALPGKAPIALPTFERGLTEGNTLGGGILLDAPVTTTLSGPIRVQIAGDELIIGENAIPNRGVRLPLTALYAAFGSRLATLNMPVFEAATGSPDNVGGGLRLKKPGATSLAGDVTMQVVGNELVLQVEGGDYRGFRIPINSLAASAGGRLAFTDAPTFIPGVGYPNYVSGSFTLAKPLASTNYTHDVKFQIVYDTFVLGEIGGDYYGLSVPRSRLRPGYGANLAMTYDMHGVSLTAYTSIASLSFPSTAREIMVDGYYPEGFNTAIPIRARLVEVAAGPARVFRTQDADGRWWEVAKAPVLYPEQFGAVGGATFETASDETGILNTICDTFADYGQVIYLTRVYKIASYVAFRNRKACRFIGPGDIIFPVAADPAGPSQYAGHISAIFDRNDYRNESVGEEYLYAVCKRLRNTDAGQKNIRVAWFGDSRWAGNGSYNGVLFDPNNFIPIILPKIGQDIGLPGAISIYNYAVAGTTLEEAFNGVTADGTGGYPPSGGTTPQDIADGGVHDWMALCFGINEFKDIGNDDDRPGVIDVRIETIIDLWNTRFAELRSARPVEEMAISFFGPTSANHVLYQTTDAIQKMIIILRRLCRLYQIHYVDMYDRWSDSGRMNYITLDGAYRPDDWPIVEERGTPASGPLHNLDIHQAGVYGWLRQKMREWFVTADHTNRFVNPPYWVDDGPLSSAAPSTYPLGTSRYECASGEGWPVYGLLVTDIAGSGARGVQHLYGDDGSVRRRQAAVGGASWGSWVTI